MLAPEIRRTESNEEGWWSKWVEETVWVTGGAYAIFSNRFRGESFFNHGGFLDVEKDVEGVVRSMEDEFGKRKRPVSCMFVQEGSPWDALRGRLLSNGYKVAEVMVVMEAAEAKALQPNPDVKTSIMGELSTAEELQEWSRTYLRAFYGSERLLDVVRGIAGRVVEDSMASLVLAKIRETAVGCAALYRTGDRVAGAYCIGTIPELRKKHVASAMLGSMLEIAERENRKLILQTLHSDSAEGFYLRQGFKRAYSKGMFTRPLVGNGAR